MKTEYSIMPPNNLYSNERLNGLHRHEVFYGIRNRKKSIKYGLIVYLQPEDHNMSKRGVHQNRELDLKLKRIGQKAWMDYYEKTKEDFIKEFGRNYL